MNDLPNFVPSRALTPLSFLYFDSPCYVSSGVLCLLYIDVVECDFCHAWRWMTRLFWNYFFLGYSVGIEGVSIIKSLGIGLLKGILFKHIQG